VYNVLEIIIVDPTQVTIVNPEETAPCHVNADVEEEEEVSLLVFVLAQPALQVQSQIVHLLLQRGGEFYPGDVGVTLCVCVSVC
jgi:hypothetical protein